MIAPVSPLFSIIICTYRRYALAAQALESVLAQDIGADTFDVWVMDNSPAGPEKEAFAQRYANEPRLHVVALDAPGLAAARNQGIALSSGRYVVFLDDDARASDGWLAGYRDFFLTAREGKIGAAGGRILPRFEVAPPPWLDEGMLLYYSILDLPVQTAQEMPSNLTPVGANMAFDRRVLEEGGSFDVDLGRKGDHQALLLSGEESRLLDKIRAQGWKLYYVPQACVSHFIPAERLRPEWLRRRMAWQAVTDQLMKPMPAEQIAPMLSNVLSYSEALPAPLGRFMGLFLNTDDKEVFHRQLLAVYFTTKLLIAAGGSPSDVSFPQNEKA